jgi:Right handed beta helix region
MRHSKWIVGLLALVPAFLFGSAAAHGDHGGKTRISGVIPETVVLHRDAKLVGDVQCLQTSGTRPCIEFGRSGITLDLNGYTMTGPANDPPTSGCVTTTNFTEADGIHSKFDRARIIGPGVVQRMRRHGIALFSPPTAPGQPTDFLEKARVKGVTVHQNCFSGVWLVRVAKSEIHGIVSARNSAASSSFPCGGTCVTNSNDNRIRHSEFFGNGSVAPGTTTPGVCPVAVPNDFGVGLVGTSSGNVIEENGFGGNINGVFVCPGAAGNLIKKNVIAGNPPIQVEASSGTVGADVRDFSPAGANTFKDNLCLTYTGPSPSACLRPAVSVPGMVPDVPRFAGHRNHGGGGDDDDD